MTNKFYFINESIRGTTTQTIGSSELPVIASKSEWHHIINPNRLTRTYIFDNEVQQIFFIEEVMHQIGTENHNVRLIVERNSVTIETRTDDMLDITDLDIEIASNIDLIFKDSLYIRQNADDMQTEFTNIGL